MAQHKILIVEDEDDIADMIDYNLTKEGYKTKIIKNGDQVLAYVKKNTPSLIVLDIMLPGIDGLEVCKQIKRQESLENISIIMLSAKTQEMDKVLGLELGADDYLSKPFSPRELIARIKAILRRQKSESKGELLSAGKITIDISRHKVLVGGKKIDLTTTEFKLLVLLINKQGIVLSRENILSDVFGYDSAVYDRTVDAHIKSLRKKLGKSKDCIETVRGVGYRFKE